MAPKLAFDVESPHSGDVLVRVHESPASGSGQATAGVTEVRERQSSQVAPWDEPEEGPDGRLVKLAFAPQPLEVASAAEKDKDQKNHRKIDGTAQIRLPATENGAELVSGPVFSMHPETLRLVAYVTFWIMVLLAYFITAVWVDEDLDTSPLVKMFGYNNVCILWDYEPATSVIAMYYPLVEVPLVAYLVLNFARTWECWRDGRMQPFKFTVCLLMFPITLIFVLWFRMIFVVKAFDDVKGHTLGFHGLMIALCLVALQNFLYHDTIGKLAGPRWMSIGYLSLLYVITTFKMIAAWSIFAGTPLWSVETQGGQHAGHFLDVGWMVLASVCPAIIAYRNRQTTPSMVLSWAVAPQGVY